MGENSAYDKPRHSDFLNWFDSFPFRDCAQEGKARDVITITIYCGPPARSDSSPATSPHSHLHSTFSHGNLRSTLESFALLSLVHGSIQSTVTLFFLVLSHKLLKQTKKQ